MIEDSEDLMDAAWELAFPDTARPAQVIIEMNHADGYGYSERTWESDRFSINISGGRKSRIYWDEEATAFFIALMQKGD